MSTAKLSVKVAPQKRFRVTFKDGWAIQLSTGNIEKTLASFREVVEGDIMADSMSETSTPVNSNELFNFMFNPKTPEVIK